MHEILLKSLNIKSRDSPTTKKKKSCNNLHCWICTHIKMKTSKIILVFKLVQNNNKKCNIDPFLQNIVIFFSSNIIKGLTKNVDFIFTSIKTTLWCLFYIPVTNNFFFFLKSYSVILTTEQTQRENPHINQEFFRMTSSMSFRKHSWDTTKTISVHKANSDTKKWTGQMKAFWKMH